MLDTNALPRGSPARGNASHWCPVSSQAIPTRVVLLAGPSGSGKSSLAAVTGLPVLRLDDFYKEHDDPSLPLVDGSSDIDWDSPRSWDADAAVDERERRVAALLVEVVEAQDREAGDGGEGRLAGA